MENICYNFQNNKEGWFKKLLKLRVKARQERSPGKSEVQIKERPGKEENPENLDTPDKMTTKLRYNQGETRQSRDIFKI